MQKKLKKLIFSYIFLAPPLQLIYDSIHTKILSFERRQ